MGGIGSGGGSKTDLLIQATEKGFAGVAQKVEALATSLGKLGKSPRGFTKMGKDMDVMKQSVTSLAASMDKLVQSFDKAGNAGSRFGSKLMEEGGIKGYIKDVRTMIELQARWYAARSVLFAAVEAPIAAIKSMGAYTIAIDRARSEMMRWGATSGQVTKQLGDDASLIVTQIRKATLQFPVMFEELSKTTQAFVGAGIDPGAVARMVPDIARMQTAFSEINFEQFAVALTGTLNVFRGAFKDLTDDAEILAAIIDKIMKAQATGIIRPEQFTVVMQYMSQVGKLSGFTLDQILAISVALTDTGIRAQSATRLMASMMQTLQTPKAIDKLKSIGIEIDRTKNLALQFDDVISALGAKVGTGSAAAGWVGFMSDLVGKEQAKDLLTIITRMKEYKDLTKAIEQSKGGLVAASDVMTMSIANQWKLIVNVLREVGGNIGTKATGVLKELVNLSLDIANGFLAAADATGVFAEDIDKLGRAGNAARIAFDAFKDVLLAIAATLGLKAGIELIKFIGLIGSAIKGMTGFGSIITFVAKNPLVILTIGITAINTLFREMNSELDKLDRRDNVFKDWLKSSKTSDLEKGLGTRAREIDKLNEELEVQEEFRAAFKKKHGMTPQAAPLGTIYRFMQEFFTDIQSDKIKNRTFDPLRYDRAQKELSTALTEVYAIRTELTERMLVKPKPDAAGEPVPDIKEKDYFAAYRDALMKQLKFKLAVQENETKESLRLNDLEFKTKGKSLQDYTKDRIDITKKGLSNEFNLIKSASDDFKAMEADNLLAVGVDEAKKDVARERYSTIHLELVKMVSDRRVELEKAADDKIIGDYEFLKDRTKYIFEDGLRESESLIHEFEANEKASFDRRLADAEEFYRRQTTLLKEDRDRGLIESIDYFLDTEKAERAFSHARLDIINQEAAAKAKAARTGWLLWKAEFDAERATMLAAETDFTYEQKLGRAKEILDKYTKFVEIINDIARGKTKASQDVISDRDKKLFDLGIERERDPAELTAMYGGAGGFVFFMTKAMKDWDNFGKQLEGFADALAKSLADSFSEFFFDVMKSNLNSLGDYFTSFTDMVLKQMSQIMAQQVALRIGAGITGAGTLIASLFHNGGVVGAGGSLTFAPAGAFANAARFHSGLRSDEMPAILQKGETVLPKGVGAGNVVVNIQNETGTPIQKSDMKIAFDMEKMVVSMILKNKMRNGVLR